MRWGVGLWEIIERVWSVKWHWPAAIILSLGACITHFFPQDIWSCRCFAPTGPDGKLCVIVLWSCAFGVDWWYGSNGHYMWKIANFGRFLMIFGPFGARYHPLHYTRNPMIDCFTVGTFHNVYSKEKSDSLYGYYGCNGKNVLKNRSFFVIFEIFGA